jgi:hypothetical protein
LFLPESYRNAGNKRGLSYDLLAAGCFTALRIRRAALSVTLRRTMKDGPNIALIASLLGDSALAEALTALMTDRTLTATEPRAP